MKIYALFPDTKIPGIATIRVSSSEINKIIKKITLDQFPNTRVATLKKFNKLNINEHI